jgi:hypothetical protein
MKVRKLDEILDARAEGLCCGLPYATELVSDAGCSIHFWCNAAFDETLLQKALDRARTQRDVIRATASLGQPYAFWAHSEM